MLRSIIDFYGHIVVKVETQSAVWLIVQADHRI